MVACCGISCDFVGRLLADPAPIFALSRHIAELPDASDSYIYDEESIQTAVETLLSTWQQSL